MLEERSDAALFVGYIIYFSLFILGRWYFSNSKQVFCEKRELFNVIGGIRVIRGV